MAEDQQIDVKQLEKDKQALAAEMEKMAAEVDKTSKSYQAIRKEFDSHPLNPKEFEKQELEDDA